MKSNYPLSRKDDIVIQEADGEVLIYDLKDNKAFCLNETSALVWEMCDGNKSVSEISQGIAKKLDMPANEDLVWLAIDQLKKEKLISNGAELESKFEGMSRRDVIKKVGFASMVALPVIAGLVAPTAVNAASACTAVACFAPNTNVCVGCAPGAAISGFQYTSTDGSCSAGQTAATATCPADGSPLTFTFDTQRA